MDFPSSKQRKTLKVLILGDAGYVVVISSLLVTGSGIFCSCSRLAVFVFLGQFNSI